MSVAGLERMTTGSEVSALSYRATQVLFAVNAWSGSWNGMVTGK